jgi:hypothetical protein
MDQGRWRKGAFLPGANQVTRRHVWAGRLCAPFAQCECKHPDRDFPKDHLHHRGVFWAWHQVLIGDRKMGDAWECRDFVWDVQQFDQGQSDLNSLTLIAHTLWKSPLWKDDQGDMKPFVKAKTAITVHSKMKNYRVIDFEISLLALEPNLKIGGSEDKKGYGGFSVRMKMPDDLKFTSSHGKVEPQTLQLDAGSWMDISGSLNNAGQKRGNCDYLPSGQPDVSRKMDTS